MKLSGPMSLLAPYARLVRGDRRYVPALQNVPMLKPERPPHTRHQGAREMARRRRQLTIAAHKEFAAQMAAKEAEDA